MFSCDTIAVGIEVLLRFCGMTQSLQLQAIEAQILQLSANERLHLIQAIARSLQTEDASETGSIEPEKTAIESLDEEDTKNLDEHGNRHPLLVMLESLEPLDDEEPFPDVDEGLLPLDDIYL
jgi:hypothetical protein